MLGSNCELVRAVPVALELIVGRSVVESLLEVESVECCRNHVEGNRCMFRCGRIVIVIVAVPVTVGSSLVVVP